MTGTFETALAARVDAMVDACTRCGKCVEVCPDTAPAGVAGADARIAVISGVSTSCARRRPGSLAQMGELACVPRGECIKACDYGVNPRFMFNMARVPMAQHA